MAQYILGIGCRRNVPCCEIEQAVQSVLQANNIGLQSISKIVSCDLKADEVGLLAFAEKHHIPTRFFPLDKLESVNTPNPSEKVKEKIGISSVCEASAKFAGNGVLLVEKQKFGNITVAIAEKK